MNRVFFILLILLMSSMALTAQKDVKATIRLKDGEKIEVEHFGQLDCRGFSYFDNYIRIKGKYQGRIIELIEYSKIDRINLIGFTDDPGPSKQHEKGIIKVVKNNGHAVELKEAIITLSCYGATERANQLEFQVMDPFTEEIIEVKVPVKDIDQIDFK